MSRYVVYPEKERKGFYTDILVMDTTKPVIVADEHYKQNGQKMYEPVCECQTRENAVMIAKALNQVESAKTKTKSKAANQRKLDRKARQEKSGKSLPA